MAKQKIQVVVEMYNGLIENVECFSTEKKAEKYIRGWIKSEGLDFPEEMDVPDYPDSGTISTKSTKGLLAWLDRFLSEQHNNEIHWFETEVR